MRKFGWQFALVLLGAHALLATTAFAQSPGTKRPVVPGGIADKPFLKNFQGGIAIGGYMDHELFISDDHSTFDQHRYIPFIFAAPTEYIHVAAEIEFEHGGFVKSGKTSGSDTDGDGQIDEISSSSTDGEIKLEYAIMDWLIEEWLNFRGGVILSPLGRVNLNHDSPLQDLTNRPLVSRNLIPTTLSESGMGIYGAFYPNEWVVGYEAYVVNGFNEGIYKDDLLRVRSGRGSQKKDNNKNKAFLGRLSASPWLGTDLAISMHRGTYDSDDNNTLTILALDGQWQRGPLEILGEGALVSTDLDNDEAQSLSASAEKTGPQESQAGFYAQANYHFGFGLVNRYKESVFTGIARFEWLDWDRDVDGDDVQQATVGLNFRPIEGTVVKIDHRWSWNREAGRDIWSVPETLFSLSLATYF